MAVKNVAYAMRLFSTRLARESNRACDRTTPLLISMAGISCARHLYFCASGIKDAGDRGLHGRSFHVIRTILESSEAFGPDASLFEVARIHDVATGMQAWGMADLVVRDPDSGAAVLVSRVHPLTPLEWTSLRAGARDVHKAEANLLSYALNAPRWSVAYVNESTGELREFAGEADLDDAKAAIARFCRVMTAQQKHEPPKCALDKKVPIEMTKCCHDEWKIDGKPGNVALGMVLSSPVPA